MLNPPNRDCLSICVTVVTFGCLLSPRTRKTIGPQRPSFVVVTWWPLILCAPLSAKMLTFGILIGKNHMFYSMSLFSIFFSSCFSFKTIVNNSKYVLSARLVLMKWPLVRKPYYLLWFRDTFFKEAALEVPNVCNYRQTHFFKNVFSFLSLFWALVFRLGECS